MKQILVIALSLTTASAAWADVTLPSIIDSQMVLQRGIEAPVWGWADEGETVTVTFAGQSRTAIASGNEGKWTVKFAPLKASATPRVMTIKGKNEIKLTDVLVGEVWLATGQSNMQFNIACLGDQEKQQIYAKAGNSLFRMFCVTSRTRKTRDADNPIGNWSDTPHFVADFKAGKIDRYVSHSAVGCFFGLALQQELGVPVAVVDSSWGGQRIESFISAECYREAGYTGRHLTIYHNMIAPLAPYALKGVLWYQGEASRGSTDYAAKLKVLSNCLSRAFNVKDIPLYQVQIAPGSGYGTEPLTLLCDTIWKAQYQGAAEIPGMEVVAIHDGQDHASGLHPARKKIVGDRLAAMALNKAYGKDVVCTGPRFASAVRKGNSIVVRFDDIDQGLESDDGESLGWFELSADGKTFVSALAVIAADTVIVTAEDLAQPRFVRMGWNERALPNLRDKNGWPVFAFAAQEATDEGRKTSDWEIPKDKEDFHVFLLMGQSNMTGGRPTYEDVPNLYFIPQKEKDWIPAEKGKMRGYALGVEFAKSYMKKHSGVTVGLIPAAKGGASIGVLHKGSDYYATAIEKAVMARKTGVIKGVLWHQGESDTVFPHLAKAYAKNLQNLVKDLRADLKDETLPFVCGNLGEFYGTGKYHIKNVPSIKLVRKALRELPTNVTFTGFAESTGCEHRGDFVHFEAQANVKLGQNYAAAYELAVAGGKPQKTPDASPQHKPTDKNVVTRARGVLARVISKEKADTIVLEMLSQLDGRDVYEYQASGGKLTVRGSSPVAMCRGVYDYLRANNMGTVGWAGPRVRIPDAWPDAKLTRVETPFTIRHCYNVCTAGYTTPYWTWQRWEQELDWLAMHGYNMIMAPIATEAVATKVWKSLGLTQDEIDDFYTGPAHLPWQRMGNIQNVGGTLSPAWHRDQVALQKKLLARMRELGIEPVVQGFAGFVPKGIARVYPESQLHRSAWGGFPEKSQSVSVMPDDPLFAKIMKLYMTEWKATFGDARYFLVDSFNEMELPKTDKPATELLAGYGRNTYEAIKGGDPDAVWVLQGWMFYFQRNIWNRDTVKALLGAVPDDRLMILDYANDYVPTWGTFNAFDGKRWVMGYVPNMGGKTAYTGKMDFYAQQVARTLQSPKRGNLTGFTISGEGLENNEVLYELMSDTAWSAKAIDIDQWLPRYVRNRYGQAPKAVLDAWQLLREGVYSSFSSQPRFGWQTGGLGRGGAGSGAKFREAVQLFLSAAPELGTNLNYRDDAVEMAAFALGARADECFLDASQAVGLKRPEVSRTAGDRGFQLLLDLDRLLASHSFHRLDRWIDFARSHGDKEAERDNYERNARQIVTVWGPPINDYSCRVWSGLIRDYYLPRVRMKLEEVRSGKRSNRSQWEALWVSSKGLSKVEPFGDPVKAAAELVKKAFAEKPSMLDDSVGPVIGRWSAADLKNRDWHTVEWDMPIDLLKDLQGVQFIYETGYSYLEIRSVELIGDGKQVVMDSHLGRTGGRNVKNFYSLKLPDSVLVNNSCVLRAEFKSPSASSYGSIRAVTKQTVESEK